MKSSRVLYKALVASFILSSAALLGCGGGGSRQSPISTQAVVGGALPAGALDGAGRSASANSDYEAVATPIGTCTYATTATSAITAGNTFSLSLNVKCNWSLYFRRKAGAARIVPLVFGRSSGFYLSRLKNANGANFNFGTLNTSPDGEILPPTANDPTQNANLVWTNAAGTATYNGFAAYQTNEASDFTSLETSSNTALNSALTGAGLTTCSAASGTVTSVSPTTATPGQTVTLTGTGFSGTYYVALVDGSSEVAGFDTTQTGTFKNSVCSDKTLKGIQATTASATTITFVVPSGISNGTTGEIRLRQSGKKRIKTGLTLTVNSDTTAPTITATNPANGATVPASQTSGVISFSEAMNTSLTPTITMTITNPTTGVSSNTNVLTKGNIAWASDGKSVTYTLTDGTLTLNQGTTYSYTLTIDTSTIKDLAGNNLNLAGSTLSGATATLSSGTTYTVTGTFSVTADTTRPTITATTPANGATNVESTLTHGTITFSEAMNTSLTPTITMAITNPTTGVTAGTNVLTKGNISWAGDGQSVTYTLTDTSLTLNVGTTYNYTLTIDTSTIKDLAGNKLDLQSSSLGGATVALSSGDTYTVTGTFAVVSDTTQPTITGTNPANGGTVPSSQTTGAITFNEAMDATLTPNILMTITNPTTGVASNTNVLSKGNIAWSNGNTTVTYTLTDGSLTLNAGTTYNYTLTIDTSTIKDVAGNKLNLGGSSLSGATVQNTSGDTYTVTGTFSVQAGGGADTTRPTITAISPTASTTLSVNQTTGTITFSEAMNQQSVENNTKISLFNNTTGMLALSDANPINSFGQIQWNQAGTEVTFTLNQGQNLTAGNNYSLTIFFDQQAGLPTDLAGNTVDLLGSSNAIGGTGITVDATFINIQTLNVQ